MSYNNYEDIQVGHLKLHGLHVIGQSGLSYLLELDHGESMHHYKVATHHSSRDCRHICQYRLKAERQKVERIMEALPKRTLKKKEGLQDTAAPVTDSAL
jgi:hypothetical protein